MTKCEAGRTALLQQRQLVVVAVLPSLEAALPLKGMHQVQPAILTLSIILATTPQGTACFSRKTQTPSGLCSFAAAPSSILFSV